MQQPVFLENRPRFPHIGNMDKDQALALFNTSEPQAVINILTPEMREKVLAAAASKPEFFGLDEATLWAEIGLTGKLTSTDNQIRLRFWYEYDQAQQDVRPMKVKNITAGVCDYDYFLKSFMYKPVKVAWMMTKPASYEMATADMHDLAIRQIRKILDSCPMKAGKVDTKLGELQLKIFLALDARIKGAVVQKTMNVHASVPNKADGSGATKEDLEKRLLELERFREKTNQKVIDARVVEAE